MIQKLQNKLQEFWSRLPTECRIICPAQQSRRFPEVTYLREDLVGNYKGRKYKSLVPWIVEQKFQRVGIAGSSHSSNLLQLTLELAKHGIETHYQLEGREGPPAGNGLLSRMVLGERFNTDGSREVDWTVPEGGSCPAALAGSLGIAGSLVECVEEEPDAIYIDSGTGFTAAALLLGLGFFKLSSEVVVVSMTGQQRTEIAQIIEDLSPEYEGLFQTPAEPLDFTVVEPPVGRSFGSTPVSVWEEVRVMAQKEGLLVDPLYSAKLSLAYQSQRDQAKSALLFISGGQKELMSFQRPLARWLSSVTAD